MYFLISLPPGSDCSRNFTSPSGVIESPGFPDKYPHNLECTFIIIVPPHMDVTLTFLTFDLENDPLQGSEGECKYDWLEVWDGLPQGESRCCNPEEFCLDLQSGFGLDRGFPKSRPPVTLRGFHFPFPSDLIVCFEIIMLHVCRT